MEQRFDNYFDTIKALAEYPALMKVHLNFGGVVRGSVALDYLLNEYNGAKKGNTVSKAYTEYANLVEEDNKQTSDKIEMQNRLETLQKCVFVLMKRSNLNMEDIQTEYEELTKSSGDDESDDSEESNIKREKLV